MNGLVAATLVGAPLALLEVRRRRRRAPGVFVCRLRPTGPLETRTWPRARRYAHWSDDVLHVHRGLTLSRRQVLGVTSVSGPVIGIPVTRLGTLPVGLRVHLDDGRVLDLATARHDLRLALGPFRRQTS